MLKGIHFVVDKSGEKTAVQIDLKKYGNLWEDFYDTLIAVSRTDESRQTLEEVKRRLNDKRKLTIRNH
jgi:predicted metal-dependent hydrolase